jgi:hypothetical protein
MRSFVVVVVVVVAAGCGNGGLSGRGDGALIHLAESLPPNQIICARAAPDFPALASRDCAVTVDASAGERVFSVFNRGAATLTVDRVVFADDGDPGFALIDATREIEPGEHGEVVIGFTPAPPFGAPDFFNSAITIESNAGNDAVVVVDLATVPGSPASRMALNPERCDFGVVGVSQSAFCDISINNVGTTEVVIVDAGFVADSAPAFALNEGLSVPFIIPGGSGVSLRVAATPLDESTSTGALFVQSLDERLEMPLQVAGSRACVARVASVNGVVVDGDVPAIHPGDEVGLSSSESSPPRPGGSITQTAWTILARPAGSSAALSSPTEAETTLTVDTAATWRIGLTVTDDLGASFTCAVAVDVVNPAPSVFVRLSGEGDLHVARNGLDWCSEDDCWVDNPNPDWGGGDLDPQFDDVAPTGVTFVAAPNEAYTVAVGLHDGTGATLRLFIDAQLELEATTAPDAGREWLVARVQVTDGVAEVIELDGVGDQPGDCWIP